MEPAAAPTIAEHIAVTNHSSDAFVYGLSLLALTRSRQWKRGAARFSGMMLLIFGVGVIGMLSAASSKARNRVES